MTKLENRIKELKEVDNKLYDETWELEEAKQKVNSKRDEIQKEIEYLKSIQKYYTSVPTWKIKEDTAYGHNLWIAYRFDTPKHSIKIVVKDRPNKKRDKYEVFVNANDNYNYCSNSYFMDKIFKPETIIFKTKEEALMFAQRKQYEFDNLLASHMTELAEIINSNKEISN